ncbi:MAG: hypothetical protein DRQ55_03445 [Planctomycetota bacterium]|nr:MAG: hypothetical protein DRQ55_03445 [Planctomycetota bacterium]
MLRVTTLILLAGLAGPSAAQIRFVDASATGAHDGSSWSDAHTDLQDALAGATAGEIWIAQGSYRPGAAGDRSATFQLRNGVSIYGGFDGSETSLSQRDVTAHPTILSGDIDQNDTYGAGLNWWQFNWTGSAGNSYHIVTGSGTNASAVLDGVTLLAGVGSDPAIQGGGGLLVLGGSPSLRNCTFQYNAIGYGSSAYLLDCTSSFESCIIKDGYTCNCGAGGWTSGVLATGSSDVTFLDCDFLNHYYVSSQSQGRGAALNIDFGARGTLIGCSISGNQTGNFYAQGGGTARGAGVNAHGDVVIDRCEFSDNFAHAGAGLTVWADALVTNSLFARNEAVSHPNGSGFDDGDYGAGMLSTGFGTSSVEVINCTFVDNNCSKGAGMALYAASEASVRNCIVYDNYADPVQPGEDLIWILKQNLTGSYDVANSCVEGLLQTEPGEDPPNPDNFPGCIDADPLLEDVALGLYSLSASSPCIDAGDSSALPPGLELDLAGAARAFDDPATPDTGLGPAPVIDMGAYEFGSEPAPSWSDLGLGLAGSSGLPVLTGSGVMTQGADVALTLSGALPGGSAAFLLGFSAIQLPFKGGTLVPALDVLVLGLPVDGGGGLVVATNWPAGVPAGVPIYAQFWLADPGGVQGFAASNAVLGLTD